MCWFLKLCQTCIRIIATNHTSRSCSNSIVPPRTFLKINRPEKYLGLFVIQLEDKHAKVSDLFIIFGAIFRNIRRWTIEWELEHTSDAGNLSKQRQSHDMSSAGLRHLSRVLDFPVYCTNRLKYLNFFQTFPRNFCYYFK